MTITVDGIDYTRREGLWCEPVPRGWVEAHCDSHPFLDRIEQLADALAAAERELAGVREDAALLDWMNEHGASVDVVDLEELPCVVMSSSDYRLQGKSPHYDIRAAIRTAMNALPELDDAT